ncbi:hypothetical protein [Halococcus saccharolyticus]|uniref:Uncharacterized protein n=1 Tax=Halococcus saccharolyticus DSM 5350 TaxID=1227455 RepID=M0MT83_9EURY|nr:hypothetical protein [Halococcus saccharolyticus]EMA47949.1 hypothetical protein C449_00715 [Halococcus saccharolyticus DSM 5350]
MKRKSMTIEQDLLDRLDECGGIDTSFSQVARDAIELYVHAHEQKEEAGRDLSDGWEVDAIDRYVSDDPDQQTLFADGGER